jgi:phosphohistidine phosphatase
MKLIIVRHAVALDKKIAARKKISDGKRPLTEKGIKDFKKFIAGQKHLFEKPAVLISSPYLRATETAEIVKARFYKENSIKINSDILPDSDPELFIRFIKKSKFRRVVIFTHEPYMSSLMTALLNSPPCFKVKKGCVAVLSVESDSAELWQLSNP